MTPEIRWTLSSDLKQIVEIEKECYNDPWDEKTLKNCLKSPNGNCIGMTALLNGKVAGYLIYENHKNHVSIANLTVKPSYQRKGCGKALVDNIKSKLQLGKRTSILIDISDQCKDAHLFLRSVGFRAMCVKRQFFGKNEDAYHFSYLLGKPYTHEIVEERVLCEK